VLFDEQGPHCAVVYRIENKWVETSTQLIDSVTSPVVMLISVGRYENSRCYTE